MFADDGSLCSQSRFNCLVFKLFSCSDLDCTASLTFHCSSRLSIMTLIAIFQRLLFPKTLPALAFCFPSLSSAF